MCVCVLSHVGLFVTPMDCSPPDFSVHRIFQRRILEWIAISYSRCSSQSRDRTWVSWVSWIDRQILYHCTTFRAKDRYRRGNLAWLTKVLQSRAYIQWTLIFRISSWGKIGLLHLLPGIIGLTCCFVGPESMSYVSQPSPPLCSTLSLRS